MYSRDPYEHINADLLTKIASGAESSPEFILSELSETDAKNLVASLIKCPKLHSLTLTIHNNSIGINNLLEDLSALEKPFILHLTGSKLSSTNAKAIAVLLEKNLITRLNISETGLTHEALKPVFAALHNTNTLVALVCSKCELGNEGAKDLAKAITDHRSLQELKLYRCEIKAAGAESLSTALGKNTSINQLFVGGNSFNDAGTRAICTALTERKTSLKKLNLMGLKLTDNVADSIAKVLKSGIESLNIQTNFFSDKSLKVFAEAIQENRCITRFIHRANKFFPGSYGFRKPNLDQYPEQKKHLDSISKQLSNNKR